MATAGPLLTEVLDYMVSLISHILHGFGVIVDYGFTTSLMTCRLLLHTLNGVNGVDEGCMLHILTTLSCISLY